jgi:hypothetical protein
VGNSLAAVLSLPIASFNMRRRGSGIGRSRASQCKVAVARILALAKLDGKRIMAELADDLFRVSLHLRILVWREARRIPDEP